MDLQWADESGGLELLQTVITHESLPSLFLIGACHSNHQVGEHHRWINMLQDVLHKHTRHRSNTCIWWVKINVPATAECIGESLRLSPRDVASLTDASHFGATLGQSIVYPTSLGAVGPPTCTVLRYHEGCLDVEFGDHHNDDSTLAQSEDLLTGDIVGMVQSKMECMRNTQFRRTLAVGSHDVACLDSYHESQRQRPSIASIYETTLRQRCIVSDSLQGVFAGSNEL